MCVVFFVAFIGFIQINIINTKALSPMGTSDDNYAVVSKEFGKDFTEFIKDDSPIKIYTGEEITVSINDVDYKINTDNQLIRVSKNIFTSISNGINFVKVKVDNLINNINTNNEKTEENTVKPNNELDSIIDGYIQNNHDKDVNSTEDEQDAVDVSGNTTNDAN